MVHTTNDRNSEQPWDENLPKNKEYIQQFHKKSEQEIMQQQNEGMVFNNTQNSEGTQWSQGSQNARDIQGTGVQSGGMGTLAKIMKVKKNSSGDITDVMMDNGNVFSINEAVTMVKDGKIEGVNVGVAKNGREFIRSNPNGTTADNLDNYPTF